MYNCTMEGRPESVDNGWNGAAKKIGFIFVFHEEHRNYHEYPEIEYKCENPTNKDIDIIYI